MGIADAIATACEIKKTVAAKALDVLATTATAETKKSGVFCVPGLCRFKLRTKPATKAGKREVFQSGHGQGQTCQEDCQGFPSCSFEGEHLIDHCILIPWDCC